MPPGPVPSALMRPLVGLTLPEPRDAWR